MRILLVGYGKMGKMIESLADEFGCEVAGMIDPLSPGAKDGPESDRWNGVDVGPDLNLAHIQACAENRRRIVRSAPAQRRRSPAVALARLG